MFVRFRYRDKKFNFIFPVGFKWSIRFNSKHDYMKITYKQYSKTDNPHLAEEVSSDKQKCSGQKTSKLLQGNTPHDSN